VIPSSPVPRPGQGGFVLLEVLIALVLFTTMVLAYARSTDNALEAAATANEDRTLRFLAARKLGEIRACPAGVREGDEGGFEEEVAEGEENPFLDYTWKVEATEMIAAGSSTDAEAEFLFERDREGEAPPVPEGGTAPEAVKIVRLVLTVARVPGGAGEGEEIRVVTFVPAPPEEGTGTPR
jgi:hypothetical protein